MEYFILVSILILLFLLLYCNAKVNQLDRIGKELQENVRSILEDLKDVRDRLFEEQIILNKHTFTN